MKLYKFYKSLCSPCNTIKGILNTIKLPEEIELINVNIEDPDNLELVKKFSIISVPALVFENGNSLVGAWPKVQVVEFINKNL